jgi:hypothetical protein
MNTCGECRQKKGYLRNYPANYERYGGVINAKLSKKLCAACYSNILTWIQEEVILINLIFYQLSTYFLLINEIGFDYVY